MKFICGGEGFAVFDVLWVCGGYLVSMYRVLLAIFYWSGGLDADFVLASVEVVFFVLVNQIWGGYFNQGFQGFS